MAPKGAIFFASARNFEGLDAIEVVGDELDLSEREQEIGADAQEVLDALSAVVENPALLEKLHAYAGRMLRNYAALGLDMPGFEEGEDLVADAIADTARFALGATGNGTRRWDPRVVPLMHHLKTAVKDRVRRLKERAEKVRDQCGVGARSGEDGEDAGPEATSKVDALEVIETVNLAERRIDALKAIAEQRGLEDAYFLLEAIGDGVHGTTNLMDATGLPSVGRVYRAKAKVQELLAELPDSLRGDDEPAK